MRQHLLVVCAAGATLAAGIAVLPMAVARGAPVANAPNQNSPSPCTVTHTMTASPDVLRLGDEVTVTLGVQAACPDPPERLHVVLVLDGSGSMAGRNNQQMKQSVAQFVRDLNLPDHRTRMVGVVEFNDSATAFCSLTNNENRVAGCLNKVGAKGGTRADLGIAEGHLVLRQGALGLDPDEITEVMVVLTGGDDNAPCDLVLDQARQAKGQGVQLISACMGPACDEDCMRAAASGSRFFYRVPGPDDLMSTFSSIRVQLVDSVSARLRVIDVWGNGFAFVAGSAEPGHAAPVMPQSWIRWEDAWLPSSGVTYALRLRPLQAGRQRASEEATGELVDHQWRTLSWQFDLPLITVLDPARPPTATATPVASPTATPTRSPMPTSTATATPTPPPTATAPTATATPTPQPVHLPRVVRGE